MQYRASTPVEEGFDNEHDEYESMRSEVQGLLYRTRPNDMCDTLLIVANMCEFKAVLLPDTRMKRWYLSTSKSLRQLLETFSPLDPLPNQRLENPVLYFPDQEVSH